VTFKRAYPYLVVALDILFIAALLPLAI